MTGLPFKCTESCLLSPRKSVIITAFVSCRSQLVILRVWSLWFRFDFLKQMYPVLHPKRSFRLSLWWRLFLVRKCCLRLPSFQIPGCASLLSELGFCALYSRSLICAGLWRMDLKNHDRNVHTSRVSPPCACSSGIWARKTVRKPYHNTRKHTVFPSCVCVARDCRVQRARRRLFRSGGTWRASRHYVDACESVVSMTPWTLWYSKDTCMDAPRCALVSVCSSSKTERNVCRTQSTGEDGASRARARCVSAVGLVSRTNDCRGCRDTFCRLGPRNECTWDACPCNTRKRTLYRIDRRRNFRCLEKFENILWSLLTFTCFCDDKICFWSPFMYHPRGNSSWLSVF